MMACVRSQVLRGIVWMVAVGVLLGVGAAWGVLVLGADRWWLGTLVAFGPRWSLLVPVAAMLVASAASLWSRETRAGGRESGAGRRGALWWVVGVAVIAELVVLGPVMGFCLPWRMITANAEGLRSDVEQSEMEIKVLTCNTLQGRAGERLAALIDREQPDV